MLNNSPRRKLFNEYARQLLRRYPSMKEEITARLQRVNTQWAAAVEATDITPANGGCRDVKMLLKGKRG